MVIHRLAQEFSKAGTPLISLEWLRIAKTAHGFPAGMTQGRGECDRLPDAQGPADAAEMGMEHIPAHRGIAGQRADRFAEQSHVPLLVQVTPNDTARWPDWIGSVFGIASGFTSQIAHAGQPPFQLWVLPRNLPRDILVGTTAIFFAATNWIKVPAYYALGQFTSANVMTSAALLPLALVSTVAGVRLVRKVDAARFYTAIYVLMMLVGTALVAEAVF